LVLEKETKMAMDRADKVVFGLLATLVTFMIGVVVISALSSPIGCAEVQEETGRETKWTFWEGCFVRLQDGRWIPKSNWVEEEK